jgi:predicted XRE-type DNA-binding protein
MASTPDPLALCGKCGDRQGSNLRCPQCKKYNIDNQNQDIRYRFGRRLYSLRTQRHLTQAQFADLSGIGRPFISDLERGRKSATLPMLEAIAFGLQVSLSEMLKGL